MATMSQVLNPCQVLVCSEGFIPSCLVPVAPWRRSVIVPILRLRKLKPTWACTLPKVMQRASTLRSQDLTPRPPGSGPQSWAVCHTASFVQETCSFIQKCLLSVCSEPGRSCLGHWRCRRKAESASILVKSGEMAREVKSLLTASIQTRGPEFTSLPPMTGKPWEKMKAETGRFPKVHQPVRLRRDLVSK